MEINDTVNHELIHAYLRECGLKECSHEHSGSWTDNEEMVDFYSIKNLF